MRLELRRDSGATYASMPITGVIPASLACRWNSAAPNMLPWSVIATCVMPWALTSLKSSLSRAAPSSIEYSVCTCRWAYRESLTLHRLLLRPAASSDREHAPAPPHPGRGGAGRSGSTSDPYLNGSRPAGGGPAPAPHRSVFLAPNYGTTVLPRPEPGPRAIKMVAHALH